MYMGWGADGSVWFASEMKALVHDCKKIEQFPPGHYWSHKVCWPALLPTCHRLSSVRPCVRASPA